MRQMEKEHLLTLPRPDLKEHLQNLDYLRQGISLRQYGRRP